MKSTFFGLQKFQKSMEIQEQARLLVWKSGFPAVLGFEYYPVITLSKRSEKSEDFLLRKEELLSKGIEIVQTDRSGPALVHSPGQLIIYPIVPLRKFNMDERAYLQLLEQTTILWCQSFKIKAQRREDSGVFTEKGKIAAIGIRIENGISKHGISINMSNDLDLFSSIGSNENQSLDSFYEHHIQVDLAEAFNSWTLYFTHELMALLPTPEK